LNIKSNRYRALLLVLISFLALYFEVILIRWIPGQVQIIGYFTNLVLIASFLGLGAGCATPGRTENNELSFLLRLAVLCGLCFGIGLLGLSHMGIEWGVVFLGSRWGPVPSFVAAILIFIGVSLTFIPLGRMMGAALDPFHPLWGYSLILLGSVLGASSIALLRWFRAGPVWWFAAGLVLFIPLVKRIHGKRQKGFALAWMLASLLIIWAAAGDEIWSPYYKIKLEESYNVNIFHKKYSMPLGKAGYSLTINDNFFQFVLNLNPYYFNNLPEDQAKLREFLKNVHLLYQLPYELFSPETVLILGAGSGNDAGVAAQNRVGRIVAVEIDPVIAKMGENRHPMLPYNDPSVTIVVEDARHFLRTSPEKFNMIVFGLLDSHRLMSYVSTIRLESFVYTYEGLSEAASHLKPGGAIVLTHTSPRGSHQKARLFQTMQKVFPGRTHVLSLQYGVTSFQTADIIIAGPESITENFERIPGVSDVTEIYQSFDEVKPITDDWPFLYLNTASFWNTGYLKALLIMVLISIFIVVRVVPEVKTSVPLHFFLLGSGFLLLETKSIIDLSLLFGSTWMVNSVAIGSFLVMALLANLAVHRFGIEKTWPFYLMLFAALALNAAFPVGRLAISSVFLRVILGGGFVALPVFFSGIIFAASFKKVASPSAALGTNVMGAVVGGFGEYTSMFLGFRSLYLVAAILYVASWLCIKRR
jgi:hypothetical protein